MIKRIIVLGVIFIISINEAYSSTMGESISRFMNLDNINSVVDKGIDQVISVAWAVALVVLLLSVGFGYLSSGVGSLLNREGSGGGGTFFKAENLFYSLFIFIIIGAYKPIAHVLNDSVEYINSLTDIPSSDIANIANQSKYKDEKIRAAIFAANQDKNQKLKLAGIKILEKSGVNQDDFINNEPKFSTNALEGEKGFLAKIAYFVNPTNWPTMIFAGMGMIIMGIIRGVVGIFTFFYFKFLLIVGPLAFAFAVNPKFKDLIYDWLGAVLSTGLVFTTMNLIDYFYAATLRMRMAESNAIGGHILGTQAAGEVLFNLAFIILYASAFKLTKTFVPGKGLGAGLVGKALGLGAAAVGGVALMAGGAAAGAGGGGGMLKNITEAAKKVSGFKDTEE